MEMYSVAFIQQIDHPIHGKMAIPGRSVLCINKELAEELIARFSKEIGPLLHSPVILKLIPINIVSSAEELQVIITQFEEGLTNFIQSDFDQALRDAGISQTDDEVPPA